RAAFPAQIAVDDIGVDACIVEEALDAGALRRLARLVGKIGLLERHRPAGRLAEPCGLKAALFEADRAAGGWILHREGSVRIDAKRNVPVPGALAAAVRRRRAGEHEINAGLYGRIDRNAAFAGPKPGPALDDDRLAV